MTEAQKPSGAGAHHAMTTTPLKFVRRALGPVASALPWTRPQRPEALDEAIAQAQLDILISAFGRRKGAGVHDDERDGPAYLYRPDRILVRPEDIEELRRFFGERRKRFGGTGRPVPVVEGLGHYILPPRADVPTVLAELDAEVREDVARPDHIIYVTAQGAGRLCPADEPRSPRSTRWTA